MYSVKKFRIFIFLSLLLHLLIFGVINTLSYQPNVKQPETIEVQIDTPAKKVPSINKDEKLKQLKQIVEQDKDSVNDEIPKDAKYFSKNNQTVKRETIAKNRGEFRNTSQKVNQTSNQQNQQKQKADVVKEPKTQLKNFDPFGESQKQFKTKTFETMTSNNPSNEAAPDMTASQTQDYLKNKDVGVETILNTKEFKYYTYFNRIRRQLSHHWEPMVREKLTKIFRQGRSIASDQDRITKLLIVLNPAGLLVKVQLMSDSGVKDLDDAAIEAFKSAAPFPNPPSGIVDADGTVKIRWDFILES